MQNDGSTWRNMYADVAEASANLFATHITSQVFMLETITLLLGANNSVRLPLSFALLSPAISYFPSTLFLSRSFSLSPSNTGAY